MKDSNLHRCITNELKFHIERPGSERKKASRADTSNRTKKATSKRFPEELAKQKTSPTMRKLLEVAYDGASSDEYHAKQKMRPTIQKLLEVAYDGLSLDEYCSSLRPSA